MNTAPANIWLKPWNDVLQSVLHSTGWLFVILVLFSATAVMLWKARNVEGDTGYVWATYSVFPVLIGVILFFAKDVIWWHGALALAYLVLVTFSMISSLLPKSRTRRYSR